jgi:hypothetical protein
MDALTIRPATAADVAALSDLIRRTVRLSNSGDYEAPVVELISPTMHRTRSRNGWSSVTSSFASTGPGSSARSASAATSSGRCSSGPTCAYGLLTVR